MTMSRNSGGGNARMLDFGKSRAQMTAGDDVKKGFQDVAGLEEEKGELEEIVDFLRNPGRYTKVGARIPKGVLLSLIHIWLQVRSLQMDRLLNPS